MVVPENDNHDSVVTKCNEYDFYHDEQHKEIQNLLLIIVSKHLGLVVDAEDNDEDDHDGMDTSSSSTHSSSSLSSSSPSSRSSSYCPTSDISQNTDPRHANTNWDAILDLLMNKMPPRQHHLVAKLPCGKNGIYYPLNLAICNQVHPVPAKVVQLLIQADPTLVTSTSLELACSNPQINLQVFEIILFHNTKNSSRQLLSHHWRSLRQIAIYNNTRLAEFVMIRYTAILPKVCGDWSMIYGNAVQTFWLSVMLRCGSEFVSEDWLDKIKLLHYMTSQSNLDAVTLLLSYYPRTISSVVSSRRVRQRQGDGGCGGGGSRLPLHEALSNYKGRVYGWNSNLVAYLLNKGKEYNVGGEREGGEEYNLTTTGGSGFGGLFVPDDEGNTPIESIIQQIRHLSSLSKDLLVFDGDERWKCLLQCIHFAHECLGGDHDDSIFLKALAIIPFAPDIIDWIVEKYKVDDVSLLNGKGHNCIEIVIEAVASHKSPIRYIAKKYNVYTNRLFQALLRDNGYNGGGKHLVRIEDQFGRLPLAKAITAGLRWENGVSEILCCYPRALEDVDPVSGLYLFMIAASGDYGGGDLNSCFELLRRYPNNLVGIFE